MRLLTAPLRRPGLVLLIAALLGAASLWLASRSHPSGSIQDLLGDRDPAARALARVLEDFPSADELLLLVSTDPGLPPEESVQALRAYAAVLAEQLARVPATAPLCRSVMYGASPDLLEFIKNEAVPAGLMYLTEEEFGQLLARFTPDAMRAQLLQDEAMLGAPGPAADALARTLIKDPLRLREFLGSRLAQQRSGFRTWQNGPEFISEDGHSILIRIAGVRPPSDLNFCKEFTAKVTVLAESLVPATPRLTIRASGAYAIAAASERAIRADLTSSIMWSIIIMQAVFLLGYRSLLSFLMAFAPVALGLCVAFGVHALISASLTPLTAVIGASLVGCGIDYSIYLMSYYETARLRIGDCGLRIEDQRSAMADALRSLAVPLIAGCATSVVGFGAVACSRVHALRDFAVMGALGLAFALAGVVWVLPAMLLLGGRAGRIAQPGPRIQIGGAIRSICARPRLFTGLCVLLCIAAGLAVGLRPIHFETNLNVMHPHPNPALDTERAIGETFGATDTMLIYIEDPADRFLVLKAFEVEYALEKIPGATTMGLPALLPYPSDRRAARIMGADAERILADFDGAVAQSSFEPGAFSQYKDFLRRFLTNTHTPGLDTLRTYPGAASMLLGRDSSRPGALTIVNFSHSLQDARARDAAVESIRAALADIPGVTLTGLTVVGYDIEHAVRHDLPIIIGIAAAAVFLLLIPSLRSLKDAALACVPVLFGIAVLLGYMSAAGERLNLANTVAVPLLIGVGIDYGIFLVTMAQQARRAGEGREGVLQRFAASFHAILLTSMMSIIGFGSLAFTSTPAVQSMGRIVAIGIAACVAGALLLLAPILVRAHPPSGEAPSGGAPSEGGSSHPR